MPMVFISNNDPRIDLVGKPEWIGFCKRFFFVKVDPNNPLDRNNWDSLDAIRFECDLEATSRMPLRSYLLPKTGNQWSLAQIHFANPSHPDNIRIREQKVAEYNKKNRAALSTAPITPEEKKMDTLVKHLAGAV